MKKLLVLISVAVFCIAGFTRDIPASWLMTGESKLDCKRINLGIKDARVVLKNGGKQTIPISSIHSYAVEGKEFTKLPVYSNGKPTGQTVFMELVKTVGDLSLYRTEMNDIVASDLPDKQYRYFLYKGDELRLALDENSLPNVCKVFGLSYTFKYTYM
jgi:hypothetical protein